MRAATMPARAMELVVEPYLPPNSAYTCVPNPSCADRGQGLSAPSKSPPPRLNITKMCRSSLNGNPCPMMRFTPTLRQWRSQAVFAIPR